MSVVSEYIPIIWVVVCLGIVLYTISVFFKPMLDIIDTIREYKDKNKAREASKEDEP